MEADLEIDSDFHLEDEIDCLEATKSINLIKQQSDAVADLAKRRESVLKYGESVDPFMDIEGSTRIL